jgi:nitroreductase
VALTAAEVHNLKTAPAIEGVIPAVLNRWSSRSFAEKAVTPAELARLFEAARWSASAYNEQPWRFVVGVQGTPTHKILADSLMGFNQAWAAAAPVLILAVASKNFTHNGKENPYALYDLGAATAALTLQAAEQGMTTHSMAGFDQQAARTALGIPEEFALGVVIALGYQGDPDVLEDERLLSLETSPRSRKPLEELVFSAWGSPAQL